MTELREQILKLMNQDFCTMRTESGIKHRALSVILAILMLMQGLMAFQVSGSAGIVTEPKDNIMCDDSKEILSGLIL